MGPIERELREAPSENASAFEHWYWYEPRKVVTCQLIGGVIARLGIAGHGILTFQRFYRDILSEAIEAAEALKL